MLHSRDREDWREGDGRSDRKFSRSTRTGSSSTGGAIWAGTGEGSTGCKHLMGLAIGSGERAEFVKHLIASICPSPTGSSD